MVQFEREFRVLLDKFADIPRCAAARQSDYGAILKAFPRHADRLAAAVFAFGPPEIFGEFERGWLKMLRLADDACAVTRFELGDGRPEQPTLAAATQRLREAGFSFPEIAKLLPDGTASRPKQAAERARNRVRGRYAGRFPRMTG